MLSANGLLSFNAMDTENKDVLPYGRRYWYPHLSHVEAAIWSRFIDQYPDAYDFVEYDVKIGPVPEFVSKHEDPAMQAQAPLYQYKIDVIGYRGADIEIIELKEKAQFYTVGQVKGYVKVWSDEYQPPKAPKPVIICEQLAVKVSEYAKSEGVLVYVV